jgi:hypothetical protein
VLNVRGDLSTQLGIAEILQLDRDSHHVTILSKTHCPSAVQTGQGRAGLGVPAHHEQPYSQIVLKIRSLTGGAKRHRSLRLAGKYVGWSAELRSK